MVCPSERARFPCSHHFFHRPRWCKMQRSAARLPTRCCRISQLPWWLLLDVNDWAASTASTMRAASCWKVTFSSFRMVRHSSHGSIGPQHATMACSCAHIMPCCQWALSRNWCIKPNANQIRLLQTFGVCCRIKDKCVLFPVLMYVSGKKHTESSKLQHSAGFFV